MSSFSPAITVPAWDERSRQRKGSGFTTCLLPDLLLSIGIFSFLRVPNVALRKERGGICPVATHKKCAHRECETLSDAGPRVGGYICFLIGGVGRMRREREKAEKYFRVERRTKTSSEKHLVLYRDIPLSIEATNQRQRRIPEFLLSTINSHAFLNFPTKSFGRTPEASHGLTFTRDFLRHWVGEQHLPAAHHFGPRDNSCMRALRHCSPRRQPLDSMNLFVTARHDRYELACSRPSCASDDEWPVVACLQVLLLLCPLFKRVVW
jgi:hypothetical protein